MTDKLVLSLKWKNNTWIKFYVTKSGKVYRISDDNKHRAYVKKQYIKTLTITDHTTWFYTITFNPVVYRSIKDD